MNLNLPLIGLGTWQMQGAECERAVEGALNLGYRHIDTADVYQNHKEVGKAIKGFPREEIFLTTKVFFNDLEPVLVHRAVERFLQELDVNYIDLLLVHWPNPKVDLEATLEAMCVLKEMGITRFVGVSNFVRLHLEMLVSHRLPILTNQIELHPYCQRKELVKAYKEKGIGITAYRPLAGGAFKNDATLKKIGDAYGKTPCQVALRWLIEQGIAVIPKASQPKHLKENFEIFDFQLSAEDMRVIETLDIGKRYCGTPEGLPVYED